METEVINYRWGYVVRGNAGKVTRGKAKKRCKCGIVGGKKGGEIPPILSTTSICTMTSEWRLIKHDNGGVFNSSWWLTGFYPKAKACITNVATLYRKV